jgi:chromate reductase
MVYKILAISGSLEKNAPSSGLIRACLTPNYDSLEIEVADISRFPFFNMDTVIEKGYPPQIVEFRSKVSHSHGILFSVAEHNGKVSAVLKNAYDWISFT